MLTIETVPHRRDKARHWQQLTTQFGAIEDKLGRPIDPGVFEVVVALNALGIRTIQSCEGHLDHGVAAPWVDIGTEALRCLHMEAHDLLAWAHERHRQGAPVHELESLFAKARRLQQQARTPGLEELKKVMPLLEAFYGGCGTSYSRRLVVRPLGAGGRIESQGAMLQEQAPPNERHQHLAEYQEEMRNFGAFLKGRYFAGG